MKFVLDKKNGTYSFKRLFEGNVILYYLQNGADSMRKQHIKPQFKNGPVFL